MPVHAEAELMTLTIAGLIDMSRFPAYRLQGWSQERLAGQRNGLAAVALIGDMHPSVGLPRLKQSICLPSILPP